MIMRYFKIDKTIGNDIDVKIIKLLDKVNGIYISTTYNTVIKQNYRNITELQCENKDFMLNIKKPHVNAEEITHKEYEEIKEYMKPLFFHDDNNVNIDFAMWLTGYDKKTIMQLFDDWNK